MAEMIVVDRDGREHVVEGKVGVSIMETLRDLEYGVAAICGGVCSCATCHVYVDAQWAGKLPAQQGDEKEILLELTSYRGGTSRLACQVPFTASLAGIRLVIAPDE